MPFVYLLQKLKSPVLILTLMSSISPLKVVHADDLGTSSSGGGFAYLEKRDDQYVLNRTQVELGIVNDRLTAMINYSFPLYDKSYAPKKFENGSFLLKAIAVHPENSGIVQVLEQMQSEVVYPPKDEKFKSFITYTSGIKYKLVKSCINQHNKEDTDACFFIEKGQKTIGLIADRVKNMDRETYLGLLAHEVAHAYGADENTAQSFQLYFMLFRSFLTEAPSLEWSLHRVYLNQSSPSYTETEKLSSVCANLENLKIEIEKMYQTASQQLETHADWQQKLEGPAYGMASRMSEFQKHVRYYADFCKWFTDPNYQDYKDNLSEDEKKEFEEMIGKTKAELLNADGEYMNMLIKEWNVIL